MRISKYAAIFLASFWMTNPSAAIIEVSQSFGGTGKDISHNLGTFDASLGDLTSVSLTLTHNINLAIVQQFFRQDGIAPDNEFDFSAQYLLSTNAAVVGLGPIGGASGFPQLTAIMPAAPDNIAVINGNLTLPHIATAGNSAELQSLFSGPGLTVSATTLNPILLSVLPQDFVRGALGLSITDLSSYSIQLDYKYDDGLASATNPEPSVLALMSLGIVGLSIVRRRRANQ